MIKRFMCEKKNTRINYAAYLVSGAQLIIDHNVKNICFKTHIHLLLILKKMISYLDSGDERKRRE